MTKNNTLILENFSPIRGEICLIPPIDLTLGPGEIVTLLGPSGRGKTSILDCIRKDCEYTGQISSDDYFSVFQENNQLFPWFSIKKNLLLINPDQSLVDDLARQWELYDLLDRLPGQVSGGQCQRFVLLRAILSQKPLLLCDEPLSSLDGSTAAKIAELFKAHVKSHNTSVVWITHNRKESEMIADKVIEIS